MKNGGCEEGIQGYGSVAEHMLCTGEALGSIPGASNKRRKEKNGEDEPR